MAAWQITRKDLGLLLRDKRALVLLVALPLIFISIIGFSTGQLLTRRQDMQELKIAVIDEARTPMTRQITSLLGQHENITIERLTDLEEAHRLVDRDQITAILVIGPEFTERFDELKFREISDPNQGKLADGLRSLDIHVETKPTLAKLGAVVAAISFADVYRAVVPEVAKRNPFMARHVPAKGEYAPGPEKIDDVVLLSDNRIGDNIVYQIIVPSYTVLFVFFLLNIMARSFIAERDIGTLRRLRLAPIGNFSLLIGKTLPFYLMSLMQTTLLFLCGKLLFGMSWGPQPWLLIPVILCTSLAATMLGLLVATVVKTDSQVSALGNFLVIVLAGISGCFMPRDWLPSAMQTVSLGTPHAWSLIAFNEILNHRYIDTTAVFESCAMLLAFALAFFFVGWWRFRPVG